MKARSMKHNVPAVDVTSNVSNAREGMVAGICYKFMPGKKDEFTLRAHVTGIELIFLPPFSVNHGTVHAKRLKGNLTKLL